MLAGTARRIARLLESRAEGDDDALARDEPLLAALAAASLRTRIATGPHAGERWRRLGDRVEPQDAETDPEASPRVPQHAGMSLHAEVAVPARDRCRLERLCRYVARPPLAQDRLEARSDGGLALRLKTRWRDGTTHILMERCELLERLVPLIPPPRVHQIRYHGVLAPCASARDRIAPGPRLPRALAGAEAKQAAAETIQELAGMRARAPEARRRTDDSTLNDPGPPPPANNPADPRAGAGASPTEWDPRAASRWSPHPDFAIYRPGPHRLPWAELLQRIFEVDALRCPRCGTSMRLVAAIEDPAVARKILECLDLPARAPPLMPASADEPAWHESVTWDEDAACAFDQTLPDGYDMA